MSATEKLAISLPKDLIDKLTPYQGWIRIVMFFWGVWETIAVLTNVELDHHATFATLQEFYRQSTGLEPPPY